MTVVVAIEVAVAVRGLVPAMVVGDLAVIAIPVAFKVARSVMTRFHPMCAGVRRTRPVSLVPGVTVAHRVPVAAYPGIADAGTLRLNPDDPRPRGRADSHSDRKLCEDSSGCQQHQHQQFSFHDFNSSFPTRHVIGQSLWTLLKARGNRFHIDQMRPYDPTRSVPRPLRSQAPRSCA